MKRWQQTTQDELKKYVPDIEGKIERLQEQLKEANEVIKYYAEKHGKLKACDYLNKWGIQMNVFESEKEFNELIKDGQEFIEKLKLEDDEPEEEH